jgi:uncharacterized protein (DUF885 family)
MKRLWFVLAVAFGMLIVSLLPASEEESDAKLAAFFKNYLEELFKQQPMAATRLGDHRFDDRLDDLSTASTDQWIELGRRTRQKLNGGPPMDPGGMSQAGQIDYAIFKNNLDRDLWLWENTQPFENDPRIYNEYISDSIFLILARSTLPKATNVKNCVARMAFIPRAVAAAKQRLRNPPKVYVETAIRQNRGAIAFYESGIFELASETAQISELGPAAKVVVASLKDYQKFLEEELLPRATGDWRLGKDKFARKLELVLDAGMTAEQVRAEAEAEFERVEREMYVMARQLWAQTFPKKPLPPDDVEGRRSTIRQVIDKLGQEHGKVEDLLHDVKATVERVKTFITERDILRLPEPDRCQIIEMPEFQRGFSVAYLSSAPPLDAKAVSFYAVSPPPREWDALRVDSFLQEYNRYMLQILTIHEGYPGHYVQLEYANRNPSLIRKVFSSGVFEEGWAVYTEQMMLDQGYGQGDAALRLHQLKWYLRSVANALLDYQMHCAGMTDEEALAFLTQRAYQSEGEALGKIVRAKLSSCQLSTYFVGRTAFYRLRQQVEHDQGEAFDLGRYHEAVLDHGSVPVKYLRDLVPTRLQKAR